MTAKDQIDLINDVADFIYNETESFRYDDVGADLAYLLWAIAAGTGFDLHEPEQYLVTMLRSNKELWLRVKEFVNE